MPKNSVYSGVGVPLFGSPVVYPSKSPRLTFVLVSSLDDSGNSVISHVCVEDVVKHIPELEFSEVTLANLISKGVTPHALDMIDTSKLGIDSSIDSLAEHIISHSSDYIASTNSEN